MPKYCVRFHQFYPSGYIHRNHGYWCLDPHKCSNPSCFLSSSKILGYMDKLFDTRDEIYTYFHKYFPSLKELSELYENGYPDPNKIDKNNLESCIFFAVCEYKNQKLKIPPFDKPK
jgi:hypothetical protein